MSPDFESHEHIELTMSDSVEGAHFYIAEKTGTIVSKHDVAHLTPVEFRSLIAEKGFVAGAPGSAKRAQVRQNGGAAQEGL